LGHPLGSSRRRGGIGVENLQGSGLIAGETSRAYQEIGDPVDPGGLFDVS